MLEKTEKRRSCLLPRVLPKKSSMGLVVVEGEVRVVAGSGSATEPDACGCVEISDEKNIFREDEVDWTSRLSVEAVIRGVR